eukprot:scaffold34774_cov76-Cyclotella_meneghiniana.AAC.6
MIRKRRELVVMSVGLEEMVLAIMIWSTEPSTVYDSAVFGGITWGGVDHSSWGESFSGGLRDPKLFDPNNRIETNGTVRQ